jgi:cyclic pyranopterin phosphate synthase
MKDKYGRTIEYMRISVTDRCDLRCRHCMPPEGVPLMAHGDILSYEEIAAVAAEAAKLGIRKIRLTGGEPLVRPQLAALVELLRGIPGIEQVVLTTNGVRLAQQLPGLLAAGLSGVNFSLNAMDRKSYEAFTGRDCFDAAMAGLHAALDAPGLSVKINCVPTKGREDQVLKIASLARDTRASVLCIELMHIGMGAALKGIPKIELIDLLQKKYGPFSHDEAGLGDRTPKGPAEYVRFPGFTSEIGFISAVSHRFCEDCNRIRLTADGRLKSCLAFPAGEDVKTILRSGAGEEALRESIVRCIQNKPKQHTFGCQETEEQRLMSQIGG